MKRLYQLNPVVVAFALAAAILFATGATVGTVINKLRQLSDVRLRTTGAALDGTLLTLKTNAAGYYITNLAGGSGVTGDQLASSNYTKFTDFSATMFNTNSPMQITNLYAVTMTNNTASRVAIFNSGQYLTNSTVTDTELGYVSGVTSAIQTQFNLLSLATNSIQNLNGFGTNTTLNGVTVIGSTAGVSINVAAAPATNVVDLAVSSATNVLNAALTILHATNGATASDRTHVRWFWTDGTTRALTIPSGWKTNVNSAVPASITNGAITKMYVTSIGDTTNSANQTNVFVSFEFYK